MIGKPHHLITSNTATACGIVGAEYKTVKRSEVNCLRCIKTLNYKRQYTVENYNVIRSDQGKFTEDEAYEHLYKLIY